MSSSHSYRPARVFSSGTSALDWSTISAEVLSGRTLPIWASVAPRQSVV